MSVNVFVDASHTGEMLTYRSYTEIVIYVNSIPIDWFSRRQNTVETSTFGAKLIAAQIAMGKFKALHSNLRWIGITIDGKNEIFCDNESDRNSTSRADL